MGSKKSATEGYKYYIGMHQVYAMSPSAFPVQEVSRFRVGEQTVWTGSLTANGTAAINAPDAFGGKKKEGGVVGDVDVLFGAPTQGWNDYLQAKLNGTAQGYDMVDVATINLDQSAYTYTSEAAAGGYQLSGFNPSDIVVMDWPAGLTYSAWSSWPNDSDNGGMTWRTRFLVKKADNSWEYHFSLGNATHFFSTQAAAAAAAQGNPAETITGSTSYRFSMVDENPAGNRGGVSLRIRKKVTAPAARPLPAFRGLLSLVLRQVYVAARNPYLKPWAIFARRNSSPWYTAKSVIGADMNPGHIIRDVLTSVDYGLAVSDGRVDDTVFQAAADTLYSEGLGLSVFWQSDRQSVEDFIGALLEIVDGVLYEDQATGKWRLKLARDDYILASLPVFDTSNIVRVERFSQPLPGDLVSEVIVKFRDRETGKPGSVSAHDIAVLAIQEGRPVRVTREMEAIPTADLAGKIAARELRQLATPLAKATLIVNRQAWNLNVGEVFRFQWTPYGIQDMVMRVAGIGRGTLIDGRIRVECVQDIFSVASAIYAPPPASAWTSPISVPAASPYRLLIEAPYWVVAREIVGESDTLLGEIDPLAGNLMSAGSRPAGDAYDYRLYTRAGSAAYADRGAGSFCPVAELSAAVGKTDTVFSLINEIDTDLVELDTWAVLDGEMLKIKAISAGSVTVARGVLDTVPAQHAAGSRIFFADIHRAVDDTEWASGQTVNAKLLPRTGLGTLAEASAPTDSLVMAARFIRPYPPGNVTINAAVWPEWIDGQADLSLTWAHRDRKQQTAYLVEQSEGNIGPEIGQTYTLRIYGENDMLARTETGLSGTGYSYATELADGGAATQDLYWPNVVLLMDMNGTHGGTTFTDVKGHAMTAYGNAITSTTQKKYGAAACYLDGNGDGVSTPNHADWDFGTGDFTIEAWIYIAGPSGVADNGSLNKHACIVGNNAATTGWDWFVIGDTTDSKNGLMLETKLSGVSANVQTAYLFNYGQWYHVAVCKQGASVRQFVDGIQVGTTQTISQAVDCTTTQRIGDTGLSGYRRYFNGYIDDVRISKAARYTANFAPPNQQLGQYIYDSRLNGKLRFELESVRDGHVSWQKQDHTVLREGYGFNYGYYYGGK